ncbi:MAG: ATP-binding protein [Spiroplasma sp.]|nr:ATP-binding protein [Spiroplasma sp.]
MKNLIPKSINKSKLVIWRNMSLVDILIILGWISLTGLFVFGLPLNNWQKIIGVIFLALFAVPLIIPVQPGIKGWNAIILLFRHGSMIKKYQQKTRNDTSLLVPYEKVVGKYFIQSHKINGKKNLVGCLTIKGFDLSLLNPEEQQLRLKDFQDALRFSDFAMTFLKLEKPLNFNNTVIYYQQQLKKLNKEYQKNTISKDEFGARQKQIKALITNLEQDLVTTNEGIKTKKSFYIFVYGKNEIELLEFIERLENKLNNCNFICELLTNYQLVNILHLIWNPYRAEISLQTFNTHKNNLSQLLAFEKFQLHKTYFTADNLYYSVNGIHDYPLLINDLWGATLACNEQTIIWNINPLNAQQMKVSLNKALNNAYTKQFMTKSHINRSENNYEISAYQALIEDINGANEVIKNVNILFLNYGTNFKLLKESQGRLKKSLLELEMKINPLTYRQLEGYNAFLPKNYDPLMMRIGREMPCATLAAAFPFMSGGLNDDQGMYLGQSNIGDPILFNQFKLNRKRKNHNQIIIGTSGSGKSFTTKKMIAFHLNMNRNVIVIDPEREYKHLCDYYHGQWIDTGDASTGRINPLQILDNNFKESSEFNNQNSNTIEATMDEQNAAPVSNHLRLLTQWFKTLYPDFNDREFNVLLKYLKSLYQNWKITNKVEIKLLKPEQFPTMTDFYHLLTKQQQTNDNLLLQEFIDIIGTDFLNDGKYEKLWNGHTTLSFNKAFVVYDVLTLFDQDESKVTAAQLHLVLAVIKAEVKHNRFKSNNEIVIIIDEAHLAIDKDNPEALNFIFQMVKRIRKYNGAIIITTQNLNDFSGSSEIKKKTTAIINNTQYSLILNLAPQDLKDVAELYRSYGGLTETEQDFIARANKGQALFVVSGYERHCINIEASIKEQQAF